MFRLEVDLCAPLAVNTFAILSQFINLIALEQQEVGKGLQSCTSQISAIEARVGGERIVVIDTPGFDNTGPGVLDEDVLASITEYLGSM